MRQPRLLFSRSSWEIPGMSHNIADDPQASTPLKTSAKVETFKFSTNSFGICIITPFRDKRNHSSKSFQFCFLLMCKFDDFQNQANRLLSTLDAQSQIVAIMIPFHVGVCIRTCNV